MFYAVFPFRKHGTLFSSVGFNSVLVFPASPIGAQDGTEGPSGEGEGEVSEWFMVLVLKTSVMKVTVGSNPTLSGFFWRCGQVVRQRIANSSLPSSNLGAAYLFYKKNFLIYSVRVCSGRYLLSHALVPFVRPD